LCFLWAKFIQSLFEFCQCCGTNVRAGCVAEEKQYYLASHLTQPKAVSIRADKFDLWRDWVGFLKECPAKAGGSRKKEYTNSYGPDQQERYQTNQKGSIIH
jgi:hypothetical protein